LYSMFREGLNFLLFSKEDYFLKPPGTSVLPSSGGTLRTTSFPQIARTDL
jgi:hypothetical protein